MHSLCCNTLCCNQDAVVRSATLTHTRSLHRSLRPWKHYVPLPQGDKVQDILPLVTQLQQEDAKAAAIAETAQKWAYR